MQAPPPSRRPLIAPILIAVACAAAGPAAAVEPPTGLVVTAGIGGGGELGLGDRKAGVAEAELSAGWEHAPTGLRPEVAFGLGIAPDGHFAVRPGLRYVSPDAPVQVRIAMDWSNAREEKRWRWLLIGGAAELRWTSDFSLVGGLDLGIPIGPRAGMPLLVRGGAAFRF
ncbi:MAG TPA: hypothetical protein VLT47_00265 [Anaeromyxobacteraceae bacterium]|nr:hypothetical protein [Anaeromyxobacteraceae bacterium]